MTIPYNFLAHQLYGSDPSRQQQISIEDRHRYAHAILTIAAADGLSPAERDYFVSLARALGMPDAVAESYAQYDPKSASLEDLLAHADDTTLLQIAPTIEDISTHNAYHTGQIFYVRKLQGSWKQDNDVPK